jgi:two-component system NtrC family sensor kinase
MPSPDGRPEAFVRANNRILIVDDSPSLHDDYRKILARTESAELAAAELAVFDEAEQIIPPFELTSASQGEQAIELVKAACAAGRSFAVAFVDVRMPPGIDGIETVGRLWKIDPELQVVICTAHTDHSWTDMAHQLGAAERWVMLKKPFDNIEVLQLANSLAEKWALRQQTLAQVSDLEQRVAARTRDLEAALERLQRESLERLRAEEERRVFERKLEETQRLEGLGVLAGGIAHDFNNILTGILVSASIARLDAAPGSELHEHLRLIEDNSRRAAELCEQMLTYAGKGQVHMRPLDLNDLVRETLELLRVSLPKDADLILDLATMLPRVQGDPARLRQVLMNLVVNAAESLAAAPRQIRLVSGPVRLDAAALARMAHQGEAQPGEFVFIEVTDTGTGMAPDTLRRIFEPFFTTKFTGRGLGLCAVLGIVRSHGGVLDVAAELGRGTTFRVYFPAVTAPAAEKPAPQVAPTLGNGRVLLVDDEDAVRLSATVALRRYGIDVVGVRDGIEAIETVERGTADFSGVLLDLTMPGMDGIATLAALRKLLPGLPVVLMSGYHQDDARRKIGDAAAVGFLQKPFTVESLLAAVSRNFTAPPKIPAIAPLRSEP